MAGAPVGNDNAAKGKKWAGAIRRALHEYQSDSVKQGEALLEIAKGVVRDALAGDASARREIGDRLDGKPAQAIIAQGDDEGGPIQHHHTVEFVNGANTASDEA